MDETWIDGFNLFHRWPATAENFGPGARLPLDAALDAALGRLARALGGRARRTVVFLDGGRHAESGEFAGLRYRFPGPGRRADDLMAEALEGRGGRAGRLVAVTDDRALGGRLAGLGARIEGLASFLSGLGGPKAASSPNPAAARDGRRGRGGGETPSGKKRRRGDAVPGGRRPPRPEDREAERMRSRPLSPLEVEAWLDYFGVGAGEE